MMRGYSRPSLSSRLGLGNSVFMTNVANDGTIELKRGQYRRDLFSYLIDGKHDNKQLISIIPFVRNLIEYMEGQSADYIKLTSCMHVKQGQTDMLTINDIINLVKGKFPLRCQTLRPLTQNQISSMAHDANLIQLINNITSNQAHELFELYKGQSTDNVDLIEEVNMMTPEGIHLNSFMYEPLIDLSAEHLIRLYNRCKNELE